MPANKWAVDAFTVLDINTDHYAHTNIRNVSAFPLDRYTGIDGVYKEHVWIYGVFYKNHTFVTRRGREGMKGASPLTMPMFIVMHVEPVVYDLELNRFVIDSEPRNYPFTDAEVDMLLGLRWARRIHPKCGAVATRLVKRNFAVKVEPGHYKLTAHGWGQVRRFLGGE